MSNLNKNNNEKYLENNELETIKYKFCENYNISIKNIDRINIKIIGKNDLCDTIIKFNNLNIL
jgi:hypothetical protein